MELVVLRWENWDVVVVVVGFCTFVDRSLHVITSALRL